MRHTPHHLRRTGASFPLRHKHHRIIMPAASGHPLPHAPRHHLTTNTTTSAQRQHQHCGTNRTTSVH